jgi:PAS domain S-box-containing protein
MDRSPAQPPLDGAPTAQESQQQSDELGAVLAAINEAVTVCAADGLVKRANPAAIAAFGLDPVGVEPAVLIGQLFLRHPEGRPLTVAELPSTRALRGERVSGQRLVFTNLAGREVTVLASAAPLLTAGEVSGAVVVWRDVTEHERLLAQLAAERERLEILSRRLVEAQETERRYIARELHDEVGQTLTAIKINLQSIQLRLSGQAPAPEISESIEFVERALTQVRNLSLDLRPSLLDDLGLVAALRWYVDRQAQRAGLQACFIADPPDLKLPPELETACFRVAQEALTNVVRHARARRVDVMLQQRGQQVELSIRDDGVGFNVPLTLYRASCGASLGLLGLQERVHLAHGQAEIISAPGQGTEIRARFPLPPNQSQGRSP